MASSNGKVLNLFDEGYLNLQDVYGNVQPFPTLVPYEEVHGSILVYKMEADHHVFLGQMQEHTDKLSREQGKELWAWLVQWDIAAKTVIPAQIQTSRKRMRLWDDCLAPPQNHSSSTDSQSRQPPPHPTMTMERRYIDREALREAPTLRALLRVVQCPSSAVPNIIEFLYQVIDFYEGDGRALKYAVHEEIPSLWSFEQHPVLLRLLQARQELKTKALAEEPETKMVIHGASERSTYKEKKPGLQPPQLDESAIHPYNIPTDPHKQNRYYAACYKSRKLALDLLYEAGMTVKQVENYVPGQEAEPMDTTEEGGGTGLYSFKQNKQYWEFVQRTTRYRNRQRRFNEALVSEELDDEASRAMRDAAIAATNYDLLYEPQTDPLIPGSLFSTFLTRSFNVSTAPWNLATVSETWKPFNEPVRAYPITLFKKLKSTVFKNALPVISTPMRYRVHAAPITPVVNAAATIPLGFIDLDNESDSNSDSYNDGSEIEEETDWPPSFSEHISEEMEMDRPTMPPTPSDSIASYLIGLNGDQMGHLLNRVEQIQHDALNTWRQDERPQAGSSSNIGSGPTVASVYDTTTALTDPLEPPKILTYSDGFPSILDQFPAFRFALTNTRDAIPQPQTFGQASDNHADGSNNTNVSHTSLSPGVQGLSMNDTSNRPNFTRPGVIHAQTGRSTARQSLPSPRNISFPTPRMFRNNVPSALNTSPAVLAAFAKLKKMGSTTNGTPRGFPVSLYFPEAIEMRNARGGVEKGDAVLLGYIKPGDSHIDFSHAVFLPGLLFKQLIRRVQDGPFVILETLVEPFNRNRGPSPPSAHENVFTKLGEIYDLMVDCRYREQELTKRWRVTPGVMTETDRGSVWEGWAFSIDKPIGLTRSERMKGGVFIIDFGPGDDEEAVEAEKRKREFEAMMEDEDEM